MKASTGRAGLITPFAFLAIATATNQMSFASWQTLVNNFAKDFGATGFEIGVQQSIREIPGLLAFTAVFVLMLMREQTLARASLFVLGLGIAMTGFFPSIGGFYLTTLIMSIGFHYYETVNQSLSLQWFDRKEAPMQLARIMSLSAITQCAAYLFILVAARWWGVSYQSFFLGFGLLSIAAAIWLSFAYPTFPQKVPQNRGLVLRARYWLYYALNFMGGARRQIFIVFAAWLMVEKFGYKPEDVAALFLANYLFNFFAAPVIGRFILRFGERAAIMFENASLICVFIAYAYVQDARWAAGLYIIDNAFFALSIAQKTYFQKIADPADMAPTAGVAFTINHIAAVFLPAALGLLWLKSPSAVFFCGAGFALISFVLATLIPRDPDASHTTILARRQPGGGARAPAE